MELTAKDIECLRAAAEAHPSVWQPPRGYSARGSRLYHAGLLLPTPGYVQGYRITDAGRAALSAATAR